ncbi:MAG: hypothetical protein OXP68_04110 [Anaerolineaceae bacterium]|nr:hypothetical protein [Anaerolineaceae bacterium]MDE0327880.1 hypothetical protein [Anaerolineaceae bacterium]
MNDFLQLHVLLAGLLATLVAGLALLWRARPERGIRRLLLALLAGAALLGLLQPGILPELSHILSWHLYLGGEFRLASALSAALPVMAALASLTLALKAGDATVASPRLTAARRLYWLALGAGLLYLAADEFFLLHEADEDTWKTVYLLTGALVVAPPVLMLRVASWRRLVALLLTGLALLGAGGILLDALLEGVVEDGLRCEGMVLQDSCEAFDFYLPFWRMLEEVSELAGFTLVIGALLLLTPRREPGGGRVVSQLADAAVPLGGALVLLAFAVWMWLLPALELGLRAERVLVEWRDGDLALLGYRMDEGPARPGERVDVHLYWQARRPLDLPQLRLSMHVLVWPDLGESVAQHDDVRIGQFAHGEAFIPGLIVRKTVPLHLPEDLPGGSHALTLRLWSGEPPWRELKGQALRADNLQLLTEDTVLFAGLQVAA